MGLLLRMATIALGAVFVWGCRGPEPDRARSPPFEVTIGSTTLAVPARPDLYQARLDAFAQGPVVIIRICNREAGAATYEPVVAGCEGLGSPVVNRYGVSTFIEQDRAAHRLLSARPALVAPGKGPLVMIPVDQIDTELRNGGEAYQLGRISLLNSPLQTTDRGWPVASCEPAVSGPDQCGIGFLVGDLFVEAHWTAQEGVDLSQAEVWAVATALDAKIKGLIRTGASLP
jgi:hypothetical protein